MTQGAEGPSGGPLVAPRDSRRPPPLNLDQIHTQVVDAPSKTNNVELGFSDLSFSVKTGVFKKGEIFFVFETAD